MFLSRHERIVRAIVEAILPANELAGQDVRREGVIAFILGQQSRMPDYLQLPLKILTLTLDLWPFLWGSTRSFHQLPRELRLPVLDAWKRSRLGVRRDLIRLYESLTLLGWAGTVPSQTPMPGPAEIQVPATERIDG